MIVRTATPADLPDLLRMGERFHAASPVQQMIPFSTDSFQAFCARAFENPNIGFWVAEVDDAIVGMTAAIVYPCYFNENAFIAQELFWWVDEAARGTGAGKRLIETIEEWGAQHAATAIFMLALADKNEEKMQNLYARRGYRPLERTFAREVQS